MRTRHSAIPRVPVGISGAVSKKKCHLGEKLFFVVCEPLGLGLGRVWSL